MWSADQKFIDAMDRDTEEPMAKIAGKLIQAKRFAERDAKILPTTVFEGFGEKEEVSDPTARLKALVKEQYKIDERKDRKRKLIKGGLLPLAPIGIAIASSVATKLVSDLYDLIKHRLTGSGYKVPHHKTNQLRVKYVNEIVNSI